MRKLELALLLKYWYSEALVLASVLTVVFVAALSSLIVRGIDINCGCFSVDGNNLLASSPESAIAKDLILLLALAFCFLPRLNHSKS